MGNSDSFAERLVPSTLTQTRLTISGVGHGSLCLPVDLEIRACDADLLVIGTGVDEVHLYQDNCSSVGPCIIDVLNDIQNLTCLLARLKYLHISHWYQR